jgi:hypothetical protein
MLLLRIRRYDSQCSHFLEQAARDYKTDENRLVFADFDEPGPVRFHQTIGFWSNKIQNFNRANRAINRKK